MVQIIPTLFATSEEDYQKRIVQLNSVPSFEDGWVQIDLMDNKFVQNLSVDLDIVEKYPLKFKKEGHLMVEDPESWFEGLLEFGVDRIIFPIEIEKDIDGLIKKVKSNNIEVGLSLNPETPVEKLENYLDKVNVVLVMGVNPGLEGQQLDPNTVGKVRQLKEKRNDLIIGVDGGVKDTNVRSLVEAGVDYLAIGSFLFEGDVEENIEKIWEAIKKM
ncbi:MAG: Ribulose-phosphate 3-epimerase [uncultured bacterium]|uniref:Ribulose-phosphate 3-epimerase n=3 Tax=Candidatus Daviesiibacteriota TaxID=1752718 RepID=A0A1F5K1S3_9BACT|nr:MAG: Ribulose-phosphate 3-epimerase [uncultured bacterium]KKQ14901.1 MAG: ribulose-phosphate 3-epimerase [Candidatus Daviesbacteria bacterium GW2011_GWA1_36_8]OGE16652.1 MAG: hypothetical protein A2858_02300 [Candidatus Daviesbacteria bacterium RIFCSPHIGHO2_01_FULL_36_37]OGE33383.1 MAG: hypothetical protein A3C99_01690 [Candidatus Daviesbacteria bacterium RIFCSPHIGHO2_02_FULL_37_9]OGE34728.1 MAG: hypothetical protein A3E66_03820 [Candidatus Daviesbacteria bacterium RIFCSPHIGHO2_12_FULL_37_16